MMSTDPNYAQMLEADLGDARARIAQLEADLKFHVERQVHWETAAYQAEATLAAIRALAQQLREGTDRLRFHGNPRDCHIADWLEPLLKEVDALLQGIPTADPT